VKIVHDRPPNYDKINAVLHPPRNAIFCYGDIIYFPAGGELPPELIAHEEVHSRRQGDAVEEWWDKYLASPEFRLAEEIPAHRAEYLEYIKTRPGLPRSRRRYVLKMIAKRLSGGLYGKVITLDKAKKAILKESEDV